jgi:hypothetical protein
MESTAQYWRSVWLELEPYMRLQLAQAFSNRAPRGRKHDFKDAERLVRRLIADELILSFVPQGEQRTWRNMTRMKTQLTRDRVRLQSQMECLLEEMRIKLSSVVSDLLGVSGLRILWALAPGESDPKKLAALEEERLRCSEEQLIELGDLLIDQLQPFQLQREQFPVRRLRASGQSIALKPHQETVMRLAEVPWFWSGFGAAGDRGSGGEGQHVSLGSRIHFLGGNLSRKGRKCRREPQQSLCEGQ